MKYELISPVKEQYSIIQQILTNRGIPLQEIDHYLNTTKEDNLSPKLIKNIHEGAALLLKHLQSQGRIYVQVDSDVDGYTSSAVLLNYLYQIVPTIVENKIFYGLHQKKDHGIDMSMIPEGTTLVIAPDSSSDEKDIHKTLKEQGIDVLVIDHHKTEVISESACVINNQLDDYPTKSLSGVGMVYKFCQYLDELIGENQADKFLDLVAFGLIADMMSLQDIETRHLISCGLKNIYNPFLKTIIGKDSFHFDSGVTPFGVAFYIAPLVNAVTRVGTNDEKLCIFESMLTWKAHEQIPSTKRGEFGMNETRVNQAARCCTNVKNRQTKVRDQGIEAIEKKIERENLLNKHIVLLIKCDDIEVDPNIAGLIANELMSKYQRPVGVLRKTEYEGKLAWMGSARGYNKSGLQDFKKFLADSGIPFLLGGHPNAFGLGVLDEDFDKLQEYSDSKLANFDFTPKYRVDYIFSARNFKPQDILEIGYKDYLWGQEVEEPLIAFEGISITKDNLTLMSKDRNPTLKITLPQGVSCIKFKSNEEEFNNLYSESSCVVINIVGRCSVNNYYGNITPQIFITDYEIIDRPKFYF